MEAEEILGEVDVLGEVPDPNAPEAARRLAVLRTSWRIEMVDYLCDRGFRARDQNFVLLRRLEGADWVVDSDALTSIEAAIVAGVVPGQHLGIHRLSIEPLDELHRLARFG